MKWFFPFVLIALYVGPLFVLPRLVMWTSSRHLVVAGPFWFFVTGALVFFLTGFLFARAAYRRDH